MAALDPGSELRDKPGPWVDLGLTLPIFLVYHFGVIFLRVQNATDVVTGAIVHVAEGNRSMYLLITAAIGVVFAGVFAALGRGQAFRPAKFFQIAASLAATCAALSATCAPTCPPTCPPTWPPARRRHRARRQGERDRLRRRQRLSLRDSGRRSRHRGES